MKLFTAFSAFALAATLSSASVAGQAPTDQDRGNSAAVKINTSQSGATPVSFATLRGVKAAPMESSELKAVKGLHVHFLDGNGGFHLAGNPEKQTNNWENLGGLDGQPVAPSYHGLCVAQSVGVGGIVIPGAGPGARNECPAR